MNPGASSGIISVRLAKYEKKKKPLGTQTAAAQAYEDEKFENGEHAERDRNNENREKKNLTPVTSRLDLKRYRKRRGAHENRNDAILAEK